MSVKIDKMGGGGGVFPNVTNRSSWDFKYAIKQSALYGVEWSGLNLFYRYRTRRRLLGICYHSVVSDDTPDDDARTLLAVKVSQFESQLKELRRHWNPISTETLRQSLYEELPLPDRAVHVSFDDGYKNNLTVAASLLAKYEIPAIVFCTTQFIGAGCSHIWTIELLNRLISLPEQEIELHNSKYILPPAGSAERSYAALKIVNDIRLVPADVRKRFLDMIRKTTQFDLSIPWQKELYEFMNWDEVKQLPSFGITVGSHTVSHPVLSALDSATQESELLESKKCIEEKIGSECDAVAYPFGNTADFSEETIRCVQKTGYRLAFTLQNRRNTEVLDPMRIHRICVTRDWTLATFRALISGIRNT